VPMNFNYSYRAFLITSLLFGILFLLMFSIKLKSKVEEEVAEYDIEYAEEILQELLEEEENELAVASEKMNIETNRAYNEAEKYISKAETDRADVDETTEEKLSEIDEAIGSTSENKNSIAEAREKIKSTREKLEALKKANKKRAAVKGANRKTAISYRLVDRTAIYLPNPVYTCEGGGKIVLNMEVNDRGKIIKLSYNKNLSTTSNGCLIDSAIEYANQASFTSAPGKEKQLGTITYNFPGQQ
jgi:hypothetical protein